MEDLVSKINNGTYLYYTNQFGLIPVDEHIVNLNNPSPELKKNLPEWIKDILRRGHLNMLYAAGDFIKNINNQPGEAPIYQTNIEQFPQFDVYVSLPESGSDDPSIPNQYSVIANFDYLVTHFPRQKIMVFYDNSERDQVNLFNELFSNKCSFFQSLEPRMNTAKISYPLLEIGGICENCSRNAKTMAGFSCDSDNLGFFCKKVSLGGSKKRTRRTRKKTRRQRR